MTGTRHSSDLPRAADVVVIGGGVIGTSVLFHLAEAGVTDAVLIESAELGSGSTSRAAGGVRTQFSDELNIRMAKRSIEAFQDFGRRPGAEIDLRQVGYLFLITRSADLQLFRTSAVIQQRLGIPTQLLSPAEAGQLSPLIETSDLLGASFCPLDGHATPDAVVQGYAAAARKMGAHIKTHCTAEAIEVIGDSIRRVQTTHGPIATPVVICAAGAWSARIGRMVDLELPVTPLRRQVMFTEPVDRLPENLPMTIDFETSFYFHREGPGLLMGLSYERERPGFCTQMSDDWLPDLTTAIRRRAPRILDTGIKGGWAGLYEITPDHNAIIGEATTVSRFLYATGFSGHGFLQAPAVGEIMRDLVVGTEPCLDVSRLSVDRFRAAELRPEFNVV